MKYGFFGLGLMLFGMVTFVIIIMFESITINNDSEYYVLKEAMRASMYEALDDDYRSKDINNITCKVDGVEVRIKGIKIIEQKFVENFTRRFASSINGEVDNYTLEFYDIMEMPPKASVKITSSTKSYKKEVEDITIVNSMTGILETYCSK